LRTTFDRNYGTICVPEIANPTPQHIDTSQACSIFWELSEAINSRRLQTLDAIWLTDTHHPTMLSDIEAEAFVMQFGVLRPVVEACRQKVLSLLVGDGTLSAAEVALTALVNHLHRAVANI